MAIEMHHTSTNGGYRLPRRLERKYFLEPATVGLAYGLLRQTCRLDEAYPSEQINSLYYDTPELDEHERSLAGEFRKDKVRLRWYGREGVSSGVRTAYLELKSRRGFASTKQRRRLQIPARELDPLRLAAGVISPALLLETLAGFGYFPERLLQPVIRIAYWRYRFVEPCTGLGVSLDCRIRSTMVLPALGNDEADLELPGAVLEIKGSRMDLPPTLAQMNLLEVDWGRYSKYSACIDAHCDAPGTVGRAEPSGRNLEL